MMHHYLTYPGEPYPLGATWDGGGVNFALFSEHAERGRACLFDQADGALRSRAHPADRADRLRLARLPAGGAARAALRLPGPRAVRPGARATASTRTSCCSTPTPRRSPGRSTGPTPCSATRSTAAPDRDLGLRPARQRARHAQGRGDRPGLRLGRRPPAAHALARHGHLRGARARLHDAQPRHCRAQLRGTYAGAGRSTRSSTTCRASASRRSSCCRSTISSTTGSSSIAG